MLTILFSFAAFAKTHKDDIVVIDTIEYTLEEQDKYSAELFVEEDGLYTIRVLSLSTVEGAKPVISISVSDSKNEIINYVADKKYLPEGGFEFLACLKAGKYKLEIENTSKFGDVSFVIETDFVEQDYIEGADNSSFEKAAKLELGRKYFGGISTVDEEDYFYFEVPYDGYTFIRMYSPDIKYFYLYDEDKNQIGYIDIAIDDESLIYEQRVGLEGGKYYISVVPFEDYKKPLYTIEVESKASDGFEKEYNNEEKFANPIQFKKEYQGNLFGIEDRDIFSFALPEDAGVIIDFIDTIVSKKGHYRVKLSDGKNIIYSSDDCGREAIALKLGKGTYYFTIMSLGEERFTSMGYKLKVTPDKNLAIYLPEEDASTEEKEPVKEEATSFDDVKESDWYYGDIMEAKRLGLVDGIGGGKYNPKGNVTVAEVIAMASRIKNDLGGANTPIENSPVGKWYNSYITFAVNSGTIKHDDFDNYEKPATRAEVAYIFANLFDRVETEKNTIIPDVNENTKYCDSIHKLYAAGILKGDDENGTFYPERNLSRAEAAVILLRVHKSK